MSRRCSVLAVALPVSSSCVGLGAVARVLVVLWPTVSWQRMGSTELERIYRPAAPRIRSLCGGRRDLPLPIFLLSRICMRTSDTRACHLPWRPVVCSIIPSDIPGYGCSVYSTSRHFLLRCLSNPLLGRSMYIHVLIVQYSLPMLCGIQIRARRTIAAICK
jgi:hypothetical protein